MDHKDPAAAAGGDGISNTTPDTGASGLGGLDEEIGTEEVTIRSKDKKKFTISKKAARMSKLIRTTIEGGSETMSKIKY